MLKVEIGHNETFLVIMAYNRIVATWWRNFGKQMSETYSYLDGEC